MSVSIVLFFTLLVPTTQATSVSRDKGVTLAITVSELAQEPVLFFLRSKIRETGKKLSVNNVHARIVSSMVQFAPPLQVLPTGTTIEVTNRDPILHNTHVFNGDRTVFNIATPNTGVTVQRTLSHPGLFSVRCDLHPSMRAWIAVVSNANYVLIEKPGVYRIENIEPGRYEVHIRRPERQDQMLEIELAAGELRNIQLPQ